MIYAIGLDSDSTFIHFLKYATELGTEVRAVNLQAVVRGGGWRLRIPDDGKSWLATSEERVSMDPLGSYYNRIIDLSSVQRSTTVRARWLGLSTALSAWLEHIPGRVVNRPGRFDLHNSAKPLHEDFLGRAGLSVPASITSSKRSTLLNFARNGPVIVKAISGMRATSQIIDVDRLKAADLSFSPVHLQRYVAGDDVRAHVVGSWVHAEMIRSEDVDYRSGDGRREFAPHTLPDDLAKTIVRVTNKMGLDMAGWDFKLAPDGTYWCLEANPMPGYDGYDRRMGGRITESLIERLTTTSATA